MTAFFPLGLEVKQRCKGIKFTGQRRAFKCSLENYWRR